ncbi:MAG: ATP-binding protein [Candidatus Aphodosoma sp.]
MLFKIEVVDTVFVMNNSMPFDVMDFYVHYGLLSYYYYNSQYDKAVENALIVDEKIFSVPDQKVKSDAYSQMGVLYCRNADIFRSMENFKKCYEIDKQLNDLERLSSDLNNFASVCIVSKQYEAAEHYILDAIDIERKLDRPDKLAIRLATASDVYLKLNKPEQSLPYIFEALQIEEQNGRESKVAVRKSQLAAVYMSMNEINDAEKILLEALPVLENTTNKNSFAIVLCQLGEINLKKNNLADADKYISAAIDISKSIGSKYIECRAHKDMYLVKKDFSPNTALRHLEKYTELSDTIYKRELSQALSMYQASYQNTVLNKKNEEQKQKTDTVLFFSIIIGILLLSTIGFLIIILRIKLKANKLMEEMDSLRTNFFTNITHEFRTPLTIILGIVQQMEQDSDLNESQQRLMKVVYHQGGVMLNLINQLLDISKIKSGIGNPKFYNGNVVEYIKVLVSYFNSIAEQKEIEISFAAEKSVINMDFAPDYISKIIQNLVSNALKYTPKNGNVYVSVQEKNKNLLLTVADTGEGIDSKSLPHIFDEFYQVGNSTHIGTGVGLSLVKQVVVALGGDIIVKSALGQGSVFIIKLPLCHGCGNYPSFVLNEYNSELKLVENDDIVVDLDKEKCDNPYLPIILVVDDNKDVRRFIGTQLRDNYNVFYAKNGKEALERALEILPDVIVSDVVMPEMDGFELCKAVRDNEQISHTSFLFVSARDTDADRIKASEVGADDFLLKPFNIDELRSIVAGMIKRKEILREKFAKSVIETENVHADGTDNTSKSDKEFIKKIVDIVYQQMDKGYIDIEYIAKMFNVSTKQLSRRVFTLTGDTMSAYVFKIRISKAKLMLKNNLELSIGEIAMKCGFEDRAHFTRSFKKITNETPSQFRKINV